jgi:hypothetical protein
MGGFRGGGREGGRHLSPRAGAGGSGPGGAPPTQMLGDFSDAKKFRSLWRLFRGGGTHMRKGLAFFSAAKPFFGFDFGSGPRCRLGGKRRRGTSGACQAYNGSRELGVSLFGLAGGMIG